MTLATKMIVVEPTPYRPIFDEARRLIGAENGEYEEGPRGIENKWGQGFPSWVGVACGMDAPLTDDCAPEDHDDERGCGYPVDQWSIEVRFDTAYGYQADNGAGCSDLHAYLVQQLGRWLTERSLTWYWYHEYTGEWHPSSDPITILGNPERGRLPDIALSVTTLTPVPGAGQRWPRARRRRRMSIPWDDLRLDQVEAQAQLCDSGDACTSDVLSLIGEIRRLHATHAAQLAASRAEAARLRAALETAADRLVGVRWYLRSTHATQMADLTSSIITGIEVALSEAPSTGGQ